MKPFRMLATASVALFTLGLLSSCGSGDEKKKDEEKKDSTAEAVVTPPAPVKPPNLLLIQFKVKDFAKWKAGFEAHDSMRGVYGLTKYGVGRSTEDSNWLFVYLTMTDVDKAKAMIASPELKERMKQGGVLGKPSISYIDVVESDTTLSNTKTRAFITHKVKDFDAWKKVYDEDKPNRTAAGLAERALGHEFGDNHIVYLVFTVDDVAKAKAFGASKELKEKMDKGGVEGPPSISFYNLTVKY